MKKLSLLLVDDEKEFIETLADRLKMRDLDATVASDGEAALSAVKEEEPDVVVLDLKMPGIDGMEVLRRVRNAYPNVQVIILTGHGSTRDEEAARSLGAFDYLKKPVDLDTLSQCIRKAFTQKMRKIERISMAAAFAEVGEFESAKEMVEEEGDENGNQGGGAAKST